MKKFLFLIIIWALSINIMVGIYTSKKTYSIDYIGFSDSTEKNDENVIDIKYGFIKFGVLSATLQITGELVKNTNYTDIYEIKNESPTIGEKVIKGDCYCGNTIEYSGSVVAFDKQSFKIDRFDNYYIVANIYPSIDNLKFIDRILKNDYISLNIFNDYISVESNNFSYDLNITEMTYDFKYENIEYCGIVLDNCLDIVYQFDESIICFYIEKEYIWNDENGYYLLNSSGEKNYVSVNGEINSFVILGEEDLFLNGEFVKNDNVLQ